MSAKSSPSIFSCFGALLIWFKFSVVSNGQDFFYVVKTTTQVYWLCQHCRKSIQFFPGNLYRYIVELFGLRVHPFWKSLFSSPTQSDTIGHVKVQEVGKDDYIWYKL